jgi:putative hydrolase of the HAD superfamily
MEFALAVRNITVIAFDADDTLWVNEPYFQETERKFCALLEDYLPHHTISQELYKTEVQNMALYGFGVKAFMLSMVETAIRISGGTLPNEILDKVIQYGKEHLEKPIEMLDDVEHVLKSLNGKYRIVLATKGDILDQERKLKKSQLERYFHHTEIMSDKQEADYLKLIRHLDITPDQFLMIGNSIKSDVLPVLAIGGHAIHVPFHTTWVHEQVDPKITHPQFLQVETLAGILEFL